MFDEDDYYSDEEQNINHSFKHIASSKVLVPSSGTDFNHLTGEGQSLLKIMKDRGFDLTDNQIKKMKEPKQREKSQAKTKSKAGFFDGGDKATLQELMKALNKAFSKADPQQASCILSYILQKKNLSAEDRNKFGVMKCNILFGLGAYDDCLQRVLQFLQNPYNKLSSTILSNLAAKCKGQLNKILSGYMDLLRAKSLINECRNEEAKERKQQFVESQIDTIIRQISHTELEYNIKMSKYKNSSNLIFPFYPEFRHRKVLKVVCGDFHTLFLVGGSIQGQVQTIKNWQTQIFGLGQDSVGQISGVSKNKIYKEPILISELSGKGIKGIWANKQSSLAYDSEGNIYEWGIKNKRNEKIQITYTVGEQISHFQKGYKHYALTTKSGKFYSWGKIQNKGSIIYNQTNPNMQDSKNIVNFSCGYSHTMAVDSSGSVYALGNNDVGQLGIIGERSTKAFKKINNNMIGQIEKVFCFHDTTFFVNSDCEVFFCGKHSYKKQAQEKIRQAEFGGEIRDVVSMSGSIGNYYITNEIGQLYKWQVDSMVKFKKNSDDLFQRYVVGSRGNLLKVKSTIKPEECKIKRMTKDMRTYEPIYFELKIKDQYGLYGLSEFIVNPKCQIFLSTFKGNKEEILNENRLFMQNNKFCNEGNRILVNQIIQPRLSSFSIERNSSQPWLFSLQIMVENSDKYYFYVILENELIFEEMLDIQVSDREKELQQKNRLQKQLKQQERRRKAQLQKQRLAEEKMRKQMQEKQKKEDTQKRAEEALKKHMRQQEQMKAKLQEQRKAKKQLLTGGGFDLNKLKKKNSMEKSSQTFLPDINQRPNSRKKLNFPKPSQIAGLVKEKNIMSSQTGFISQKPTLQSKESGSELTSSNKSKGLVKRGLSRKK